MKKRIVFELVAHTPVATPNKTTGGSGCGGGGGGCAGGGGGGGSCGSCGSCKK